jgi:hypothetical protein
MRYCTNTDTVSNHYYYSRENNYCDRLTVAQDIAQILILSQIITITAEKITIGLANDIADNVSNHYPYSREKNYCDRLTVVNHVAEILNAEVMYLLFNYTDCYP